MRNLRSWLYRVARVMGDIEAIRKGRAEKRIARRIAGRQTGRLLRRLFK